MADSSNQPKLDQQQSHQPLLAPQLIAVNSTAAISQPASLPVARPAAPVIVRPHINHSSPARSLFVIRPTAATVTSPASRIIVQQTSPHPIVAQTVTPAILTPSPLDADNQPDASNAPVATLLRSAPISMRFDGQPHPITAKPLTDRLSVLHRLPCGPGNYAATATKLKIPSATQGPTPSSPQRKVIREMQVRVCTRPDRKFSVLRYNAYDRIDLSGASSSTPSGDNKSSGSTLQEVFLQRENNLRQYKATHSIVDVPTRGAGSEFGQEAKEEARLRRLGIVRQGYRVEDQPWLLTVGKGRTAKRYKGVREGSVSANVRHFIFCQTKDGNFDAYPVHEWYKFNPEVNYRFLRDEEAEAEYSRRHKTMNLFNVMVKRKMADESTEEGAVDINEPNIRTRTGVGSISKSDKSVKQNRSSALLLTELDEWKGLGLDDDDDEEEEDDNEGGAGDEETAKTGEVDDSFMKRSDDAKKKKTDSKKKRAAAIVARKRRATKQRARRRRKGVLGNSSGEEDDVNEEAWDESDPDDHEGDEVDYITDSSSDEEKLSADDREQIYQEQGVDEEAGLKVLLTDISDSEEELQNKPEDSNFDEYDLEGEEEAEGDENKTSSDGNEHKSKSRESRAHRIKANSLDSSSNDDDSDESSDDSSSDSSSSSGSDSDIAPDDPAHLARKAQKKEELLQRISEKVSVSQVEDQPSSMTGVKRFRNETTPATADPQNAPKRPKQVEPASDDAFTAAVRKYLMRKPITVSDLLKKIRSKRLVPHASQPGRGTGGSGTDDIAETMLANALRQLRPLKHIVNGQPFLSLKR